MVNLTAVAIGLYFAALLALWLMCLFRPSMCTNQIRYIGAGASLLALILMLLQMGARAERKTGGFLMVLLFLLFVLQTVLWATCLTQCSDSAADTIKWSGIGSAILAVAVAVVAYIRSKRA